MNVSEKDINSYDEVKTMLSNLEDSKLSERPTVLETQAHILNFKRQRIENDAGIRKIILRRNKLSDKFALSLQKTLFSDKYLKVVDLAGNKIKEPGFKVLIKLALLENGSILSFDGRLNPGCTDKIRR